MDLPHEVKKNAESLPVDVFEVYPLTFPSRPAVLTVEADSHSFVSIVSSGKTQPFKTEFDTEWIVRKGVSRGRYMVASMTST